MAVTPAGICNIPARQQNGARNWQAISIRLRALSVVLIRVFRPRLSSIRDSVIYLLFEWPET